MNAPHLRAVFHRDGEHWVAHERKSPFRPAAGNPKFLGESNLAVKASARLSLRDIEAVWEDF
jgi:hypothetical protein